MALPGGTCLAADVAHRLTAPWPDPDRLDGVAGEPITFASHSPFTLMDVGASPARNPATRATGTLFMPRGAAPAAPVPAVVIVHGAAGVLYARELTYGRQFAAMGIAALVVDAFESRRDRARGFVERLLEITEMMMVADAYGALRHLAARPEIDGTRVVLIGFSYGGMVSIFSAYRMVARRAAPDGQRFAGHVAFYGPCIARFDDPRTTGAPVLMLSGSADEIVDQARCREIRRDLEAGGARVASIVYPGAYHQWDGGWPGPFRRSRGLADCRFTVERDGVVRDRLTFLPMSNRLFRAAILAVCVDGRGYLTGRDDAVRARSNRDLGRFLARVFAR